MPSQNNRLDPPRYDTEHHASLPSYQLRVPSFDDMDEVLPAYSGRIRRERQASKQARIEHVFALSSSKSKSWATLKMYSYAKSPQQIPTFMEGEPIIGNLEVDLSKEDSILSASVTVTGRIVTAATVAEIVTFLSHTHRIWTKGDPPANTPGRNSPETVPNGNVRAVNHNLWPFTFSLPSKVAVPGPDGVVQSYRLPETFVEDGTRATIYYDLEVTITRSMLRSDTSIQTPIAYIPATSPGSPSLLRQLAYQENSPLLPPESDPEGWHVFPATSLRNVSAQLALATPSRYTRGTVIPLFLTLTSPNSSLFSHIRPHLNPPTVRLLRRITYQQQNHCVDMTDGVSSAVWWPANDGSAEPGTRRMYGEIKLKKDLKPTMTVGHFSVEYSLALFATNAPLKGGPSKQTQPIFSHTLEIVTQHSRGPRVRAYAPPTYQLREETHDKDKVRHVDGIGRCMDNAQKSKFLISPFF